MFVGLRVWCGWVGVCVGCVCCVCVCVVCLYVCVSVSVCVYVRACVRASVAGFLHAYKSRWVHACVRSKRLHELFCLSNLPYVHICMHEQVSIISIKKIQTKLTESKSKTTTATHESVHRHKVHSHRHFQAMLHAGVSVALTDAVQTLPQAVLAAAAVGRS